MTIESWLAVTLVCGGAVASIAAVCAIIFTSRSKPSSYHLRPVGGWPRPPQPTMNQAEFDRGHNWAESVIRMDGDGAIEMLEEFVIAELDFGRFSDFDRGVRQAIAESQTSAQIEQEQQERGSIRDHVALYLSGLTVDEVKYHPFDQGYFETKDALETDGSDARARVCTLILNDGTGADPWRPLRCKDYLEGCAQAIYEWEQEQK